MPKNQIGRVVGLGSSVLFDKDKPRNPINRRISIIVMNKETDEGIEMSEGKLDDMSPSSVQQK
jgi:chemotaxis protein MotB